MINQEIAVANNLLNGTVCRHPCRLPSVVSR